MAAALSSFSKDFNFRINPLSKTGKTITTPNKRLQFKYCVQTENGGKFTRYGRKRFGSLFVCNGFLFTEDSWAQNFDSPVIASLLSAFSLLPYVGFLYFITKSKSAPRLTLFGFYFLLAFVGAAIPAGIYANVHYATSLSNVDWLHGGAESLLMVTNLFIVLGLRQALRETEDKSEKNTKCRFSNRR